MEASSFQKACNNKLVAVFSCFPVVTYMPKSGKRQKSYECWNIKYMKKKIQKRQLLQQVSITPTSGPQDYIHLQKTLGYIRTYPDPG
jgi:hypothetical protein